MRNIPPEMITALESRQFTPVFLVELYLSSPIYFCSLYSDFTALGNTYAGAGSFGSINSVKENNKLDPQSLEITLTAIKDVVVQAVLGAPYINRRGTARLGILDADYNLISDPMVYFDGKIDSVKVTYGKTSSMRITVRDNLADWSRTKVERNINTEQQARYPGDKGMEFIGQIGDNRIIWPTGNYYQRTS